MAKKKKKKLYDEVLDLDVGPEWLRAVRLEKKIQAGDKEAEKEYRELKKDIAESELVTMTEEEE
jgi:hypothetical protein